MNPNHTHAGSSKIDGIAWTCLSHLEQEEAMLSATLSSVRDIRSALMKGDLDGLAQSLQRQQHTAHAAVELRKTRTRLKEHLAAALGVPLEDVTLRLLAQHTSATVTQRILTSRARLAKVASEVDALNHGNAALVRQSAELLQRFLSSLTGRSTQSARYASSGQLEDGGCDPMFQTRC